MFMSKTLGEESKGEEMKVLTRMNVTLEVVDPKPYSEDEVIKNIQDSACKHAERNIACMLQRHSDIRIIGKPIVTIVSVEETS